MQINYFIKFSRDIQPQRLVVKSFEELWEYVRKMVHERGETFEWIIRD